VAEVLISPPDYATLYPVTPDLINMSVVVPLAHAAAGSHRLEDFFAARVGQVRSLAHRVAGAERIAPVQAMGPLAYDVDPPTVGGPVLGGGAAGGYGPRTREGVSRAL